MNAKELIDTLALAPIERHALLGSRDNRRKAFTCYLAMREKIAVDFLPIIYSASPYINDHTRGHLERVLAHLEAILVRNFPKPSSMVEDIPFGRLLTWADMLILLNALAWHDIGNVYGREGHAQKVHDLFNTVSGLLYDSHLSQYIKQVAEAHSGPNAIERVIPSSHAVGSYEGEDIHLHFLAGALRFADELDEDHRRCNPTQWDDLKLVHQDSQRFWYFSSVNSSIQIKSIAGEHSFNHEVEIVSHVPASDFDRTFKTPEGSVRALTEYFRRICKMEHERKYCDPYLRSAYYHPGIAATRVFLRTHEHEKPPASGDTFEIVLDSNHLPGQLVEQPQLKKLHDYIVEGLSF
jgi:hypothetical protein